MRCADAVQFQSAAKTGWLLSAERLAGDSQPAEAVWRLRQKPRAPAAVGCRSPIARCAGPSFDYLWPGQPDLFRLVPVANAVGAGALFVAELGFAGAGCRR